MNHDEFMAHITATSPDSAKDVLQQLRSLPKVDSASAEWFHGHVQIRVTLRDWTYNAMAEASCLIDAYAREHVTSFGVTSRFDPPSLMPPEAT